MNRILTLSCDFYRTDGRCRIANETETGYAYATVYTTNKTDVDDHGFDSNHDDCILNETGTGTWTVNAVYSANNDVDFVNASGNANAVTRNCVANAACHDSKL
jgi:hypothetical protein